ncbi:MAG: hypothetical protein FJ217_12910 [Ignavibacteria bacterium]|nr:hypothetical protein [Ignavibacteria bacterium]
MKSKAISTVRCRPLFCIVTILLGLYASTMDAVGQFTQVWKVNAGTYQLSSSGDNNRGAAYNPSTGNYLVANRARVRIYVYSGSTGALLDSLNMTGVSGGTIALIDVEVAADGAIYACNLVTSVAASAFKIYRWASEASGRVGSGNTAPTAAFSGTLANGANVRIGDAFDVAGSDTGTVILASGNAALSKVYKWTTTNGAAFTFADSLTGVVGQDAGAGISQVSAGGDFYTSKFSSGTSIKRYVSTGSSSTSISTGVTTAHADLHYFTAFGRNYVATAPEFTASGGGAKLIDVMDGEANARIYGKTPNLGTAANTNASGDVDVYVNSGDNSITLFVLVDNNGIAAYKTVISSGATVTWDGGAGTTKWSDAANWSTNSLPSPADDVVLDNSSVSGSYTVDVDASTLFSVRTLQIGYSGNTNTINLNITASTPELFFGDGLSGTDDLLISQGGVLQNSSTASSGDVLVRRLPSNDRFRIAGGGRVNHNCGRSVATPWFSAGPSQLDAAGTFEYQVNASTPSVSGRTYGHLSFAGKTHSISGSSALTVTDLLIPSGGGLTSTMSGDLNIAGNLTVGGTLTLGATQRIVFNGTSPQTISGNAVAVTGKMEISRSGGVSLGTNVTVSDSLVLSSGTLNIGGSLLTLNGGIGTQACRHSLRGNCFLSC